MNEKSDQPRIGLTRVEVAELLNMTPEQVRTIERRALYKVKRYLEKTNSNIKHYLED